MAKIKNNGCGQWSGMVGPVVFCSGTNGVVVRSRPRLSAQRPTAAQQLQRERLSVAGSFIKPLLPMLRIGFSQPYGGANPYNRCMGHLLRQALSVEQERVQVDVTKVLLGIGPLAVAAQVQFRRVAAQVVVGWDVNVEPGCGYETDRLLLTLYRPQTGAAMFFFGPVTRAQGQFEVTLSQAWFQEHIVGYIGFCSADGTAVSNVVYAGQILPPE